MKYVIATPKEGQRVRHPNGKLLDPAGEKVVRDSFWIRREKDGDVTLGEVPAIEHVPEEQAPAAGKEAVPAKKAKA